jgi:Flp pilus assembly protein TadD
VSRFVTCAACGARMAANRTVCVRCEQPLKARPADRPLQIGGLAIPNGAVVGAVVLVVFAAIAALAVMWRAPSPVEETARPASPALLARVALPPPRPPVSAPTPEPPSHSEGAFLDNRTGGVAAFKSGDLAAAQSKFEEALAADPDDPGTINNLGQVLIRLGDRKGAIAQFSHAAAVAPHDWASHFNLAHALGEEGDWAHAVSEYQTAASLFPSDYATQYNLAMALHKQGDESAAIPAFEKAIQLAPGEPTFHLSLAVSLEAGGRGGDAAREYQKYLDMAPSAPDAAKVKAHLDALAPATPSSQN